MTRIKCLLRHIGHMKLVLVVAVAVAVVVVALVAVERSVVN